MEMTPLGMVMLFKLTQSPNASRPMEVTPSGMVNVLLEISVLRT
jgi:hypothetical protein